MAFARLLRNLLRDPGHRQLRRADHPRRGSHLRPRRAVLRGEDLRRRAASATPRSTPGCSCQYAERPHGPDPRGGHHRGRRDGELHRRGDVVRDVVDDRCCPFFLYYSMFGFQRIGDLIWQAPTHAGARLPARLHRRAHDDERRGPPARGRPLAAARLGRAERARLRPGVRLRGGGASSRTASSDMYGPDAEDVIYYLTLYNENYEMPAMPVEPATPTRPRAARPGSCAGSTASPTGRASPEGDKGPSTAGDDPVLRDRLAGGDARPARLLAERLGRRRPRPGRSRATRRCARTRSRSSAGTGCTLAPRPACRYVDPRRSPERPGRSWPSPTS